MTGEPNRPEFVVIPREPAGSPKRRRPLLAAVYAHRAWRWGAAVAFAGVLAAAALVLRNEYSDGAASMPASTSSPSASQPGRTTGSAAPWPRAPGGCGSEVFRPLISAAPMGEPTGLRLTIGAVRAVDADTGATSGPQVGRAAGEVVARLATRGADTYALLLPCAGDAVGGRVVRVGPGGQQEVGSGRIDRLLAGGDAVWGVAAPVGGAGGSWVLDPLNGGPRHALPAGLEPVGVHGDLVVGRERPAADPDAPPIVAVVEAATGHVRARLGPAGSVTVGAGLVLWSDPACPASGPCPLHTYGLIDGQSGTRPYELPPGGAFTDGVVSPEQRLFAFQLPRAALDPRYDIGVPAPPYDIGVLHLHEGRLDVVPGLELSGASSAAAALTFSPDGRWLAMTLDDGTRSRLLIWRPGLDRVMESPANLPDPVRYTPAVVLTPR